MSIAPALAAAAADSKEIVPEITAAEVSLWEFRAEPYGWLTSLDGTTMADGVTTDIDSNFYSDIVEHLNMAAALQFEARYDKRWGFILDGFYSALGDKGPTPGPDYESASLHLKQFIGQATVSYRVYESPKGFVDILAGARYNGQWLDVDLLVSNPGVAATSARISSHVTTAIAAEARAIVEPRIKEYKAAAAVDRTVIEGEISQAIQTDARTAVRNNIGQHLEEVRRNNQLGPEHIRMDRLVADVAKESEALASATAELKVAQMRAVLDPSLKGAVTRAQNRVVKADRHLARAIDTSLQNSLPTVVSADEQWVDPIIGFRGQYNINDKWFLAANGDIGGFGLGSDVTWSLEATFGYNFSERISAELGYRYMFTDYEDGGFVYDMAQAGIYTGLSFKF